MHYSLSKHRHRCGQRGVAVPWLPKVPPAAPRAVRQGVGRDHRSQRTSASHGCRVVHLPWCCWSQGRGLHLTRERIAHLYVFRAIPDDVAIGGAAEQHSHSRPPNHGWDTRLRHALGASVEPSLADGGLGSSLRCYVLGYRPSQAASSILRQGYLLELALRVRHLLHPCGLAGLGAVSPVFSIW